MRYFLGIDGGQSSTTAAIADESGHVVGLANAGPCNHVSAGEAEIKFRRVIGDCVHQACMQAQLNSDTVVFAAACLGFSGGPKDKDVYSREIIRSERYKITDDAEIALAGALAGSPGITVISGTGSIVFGRNAGGRTARAGGWGYVFGDEGGAFDLVRRALRAILEAEEGWGEPTFLTAALLSATNVATANDLLHAFYQPLWPRSRVATLASKVTQAAESGDVVAQTIFEDAAASLARYIAGVHSNLFADLSVPVATIGGTFKSAPLREALAAQVQGVCGCPLIEPQLSPVEGALLEARRLAEG